MLGICQGGTFSLMYTALHQKLVKNLITMVTPLDFSAGCNLFTHLSKYYETDKISETFNALPGDLMNMGFLQLKPFELLVGKYSDLSQIFEDPEKSDMFLRMEKWIFDSPAQSGPAWHKFIRDCYQKNSLIKNEMELGEEKIILSNITCPILNITAEKDHLVPLEASKAIEKAISSTDYTYLNFNTGHIGIFVSGMSNQKIAPEIAKWIKAKSE